MSQKPQIELTILERDKGFPLRFRGRKLAEVSSLLDENGKDRSAEILHWTELALYQTEGGKYVCEIRRCTRVPGEKLRRSARACETIDEMHEYLGKQWLARRLYRQAGLERYEDVD